MRLLRAFGLAILLLAPAHAEAPAPDPVDIRAWNAGKYNDHLMDVEFAMLTRIRVASNNMPDFPDPRQVAEYRLKLLDAVSTAQREVERVPPWHEDPTLRDAVLDSLRWMSGVLRVELVEMYALGEKRDVVSADLDRVEALNRVVQGGAEQQEQRVIEVQRAFAAKNRLTLVKDPRELPAEVERPTFKAEGLPPPGSTLDPSVHVSFAVRYFNGLVSEKFGALTLAFEFQEAASVDGGSAKFWQIRGVPRLKALEAEIQERGPWQGDASLQEAALTLQRALTGLITGPGAELAALLEEGSKKKAAVARRDQLRAELDQGIKAQVAAWDAASAAFQARWYIAEYERWLKALPPAAAP